MLTRRAFFQSLAVSVVAAGMPLPVGFPEEIEPDDMWDIIYNVEPTETWFVVGNPTRQVKWSAISDPTNFDATFWTTT